MLSQKSALKMLSIDIMLMSGSEGFGAIVGGNVDMSATGPISPLLKNPAKGSFGADAEDGCGRCASWCDTSISRDAVSSVVVDVVSSWASEGCSTGAPFGIAWVSAPVRAEMSARRNTL